MVSTVEYTHHFSNSEVVYYFYLLFSNGTRMELTVMQKKTYNSTRAL